MADDAAKAALCGAVSRFLDSPDLSDFSIRCDYTTFKVHRFLLCLHSDVLAKYCTGDFKEAKTGQVNLSAYEVQHIDALVKYLYTFDYSVDSIPLHASKMSFHVNMCVIADKYNIAGLKTLSISKFKAIVDNTINASELANACDLAYNGTLATAAIREMIVNLINKKRQTFLPSKATDDSKKLEQVARSHPDLALDVAKCTAIGIKPKECVEKAYTCGTTTCKVNFTAHVANSANLYYTCPACTFQTTGHAWNTYYYKR